MTQKYLGAALNKDESVDQTEPSDMLFTETSFASIADGPRLVSWKITYRAQNSGNNSGNFQSDFDAFSGRCRKMSHSVIQRSTTRVTNYNERRLPGHHFDAIRGVTFPSATSKNFLLAGQTEIHFPN